MESFSAEDLALLGAPTMKVGTPRSPSPTTIRGGRKDAPADQPCWTPSNPERWTTALYFIPVGEVPPKEITIDLGNPREMNGRTYLRTEDGRWIERRHLCGKDKGPALCATLSRLRAIRAELKRQESAILLTVFSTALHSNLEAAGDQLSLLELEASA